LIDRPSAPSEESATRRGNRAPRCTPRLPRASDFRSEVPRRFDRTLFGSGPPRSAFAVSGGALRVFSLTVTTGFEADGTPLFGLPCSSKPSFRPSAGSASAWRIHLSWGSVPYSDRSSGCPYAPEVPPSGTIRPQGFPPSRRLASPKTLRASSRLTSLKPCGPTTRARPLSLLGFLRTSIARPGSFDHRQGDGARLPSSRPSPPPRRTRFGGLSSLALPSSQRQFRFKGTTWVLRGAAESRS
jgi:hypothetical protein